MTGYEFLPVGVLPTHRAVRLTLRLAALREPVRTLRKPRTIPFPRGTKGSDRDDPSPPWVAIGTAGLGAQRAWDQWTAGAEHWLLKRANIPDEAEGPYNCLLYTSPSPRD